MCKLRVSLENCGDPTCRPPSSTGRLLLEASSQIGAGLWPDDGHRSDPQGSEVEWGPSEMRLVWRRLEAADLPRPNVQDDEGDTNQVVNDGSEPYWLRDRRHSAVCPLRYRPWRHCC